MGRYISRGFALMTVVLLTCAHGAKADNPKVHVLVPGFRVQTLPIAMTNVNGLAYGPDGKLYALGYDGRVSRLVDTDGDGVEDEAEIYWDKTTLVSPIALVWGPRGLYVSSHQKISLLVDEDDDGRADRDEVVATGWPKVPTGSNLIDVMGFAFDKAGTLYAGIGCADFTNAYLIRDGKAHYTRDAETGSVLEISGDGKRRSVYATGLRFTFALKFNAAGDLFATEQEGATWLEGANVLDEVNQIQSGRHYGWPPRHPEHLPDVIDEPPTIGFRPQHASACGMVFNEPRAGQSVFGPAGWAGDAFVALYSRGRIARVRVVKTPNGYVGQTTPFATMNRMPTDVAISPDGALYAALHSGLPDWGTGPQGEGHIVKLTYADPGAPQPVAAWSAGPLEARIAFDRAVDASISGEMVGKKIAFGAYVGAGDRLESFKPPYKVVEQQIAAPRGTINVAAARLVDDERTLTLTTDPQPWNAVYALTLPDVRAPGAANHAEVDIAFNHFGVEATWESSDGSTRASEWWPHTDLDVNKRLTEGSATHARAWKRLGDEGRLVIRTGVVSVVGPVTIRVATSGTLTIEDATLDGEPGTIEDGRSCTLTGPVAELPGQLELVLKTGETSSEARGLRVSYSTEADPTERPFRLEQLIVPWAPVSPPSPVSNGAPPPELAGADASRGAAVFVSDEAKCASCHLFRGQGKNVGPDLSNLHERDIASIFRDISEPSATINPDYVPYTVALKDGRVLAGIVRAEGETQLRVTDTNAQSTIVERGEIEELRPSATSIMPVGLAGAIGEAKLRDLVKFLTTPPEK